MQVMLYDSLVDLDSEWDVVFRGENVDHRDLETGKWLKDRCRELKILHYDRNEMHLVINDEIVELYDLCDYFIGADGKSFLIDSTSLGIAELAILTVELEKAGISAFDVIYAEPSEYRHDSMHGERVFNLSSEMLGFEEAGIPGISRAVRRDEPRLFIFLMGYESERFRNALEISDLSPEESNLIFGIPGFKFGWDKYSFLSNARPIMEYGLENSLLFCGANNICGVYRTLCEMRKKHQDETFFIVPLGPKPMSLGALRFLCKDHNSSLLYDHASKSRNGSSGIGKIHLARGFLS